MIENIINRLETTLANIEFQNNYVFWDDIEKLEEVINKLKVIDKKYLLVQSHHCYPKCSDNCVNELTV